MKTFSHGVRDKKKHLALLAVLLFCTFICCVASDKIGNGQTSTEAVVDHDKHTFEIFFLDVGQGDAACVLCDGKAMLIDGGSPAASSLIYSFLRSHNITYLDYIIASHPDADHIGGLAGALNYADVGTAYCTVTEHDTKTFKSFKKYLSIRDCAISVPKPGQSFALGTAMVTILYPEEGLSRSDNTSIALRIEYDDTSFFFTGDCERADEEAILSSSANVKSDVLKVGHHGSSDSTGTALLDAVQPSYAVISVGGDNTYGHPTEEVLSRLHSDGVALYRTDIQGDVHCVSDGTTIAFNVERNADFNTFLAAGGYNNYLDALKSRENNQPARVPSETDHLHEAEDRITYIVNISNSSHRFHLPDCPAVSQMKETNKLYFTGARDELIDLGYTPCGICHP